MNIYSSNTTNFNNNGLGFLTDIKSAIVHDELNGNYELTLEYIVNGHLSEYLEKENIIKCKVADTTFQLFRITNVQKNFKTIKVTAKHIFYDLLNNFLADTYPTSLNAQNFLTHILNNTNFETSFTAYSDITNLKTARYVRINPVQAIMGDIDNSMINLFGGELKRDNFTINFLSRVGEDNGVKLLVGKNITGIDVSIDITEMATRVMPEGYDGLLLPELYVDSPLINNYPTPKIIKLVFDDIKYDPEDESAYHNINDAYAALRAKVNEQYSLGLDKPKININVNWIDLSKTEEYKQYSNLETIRLGDTITTQVLGMNYETRVISTDFDVLRDRVINFQIGTFTPTIATQMNKIEKSIEQINPTSILQTAQDNATQLITTAMGGYVYKTENELYIMDTNDPATATKVWRWNINGLGYSSTGINGTYGIAITMDGSIVADFIASGHINTNLIQGYGSLTTQVQDNTAAIGDRSGRTSTITQDIASIEAQISDIADITTSSSSENAIIQDTELQNIAASFPIRIEIHPIIENISYLYPSTGLFPSPTLYPKIRDLLFTNTSTNETFKYTLPLDLLYYDENNYDSFVADYETDLITITKKCTYNSDGSVSLLQTPQTITYDFSLIEDIFALTEGNYQVELPGYSTGFLFIRLMVLNAYTAQYATKVELRSAITQTSESIISEVSQNYTTKEESVDLSTRIGQTAKEITLEVNNGSVSSGIKLTIEKEDGDTEELTGTIEMNGLVKFTDLSTSGSTEINGDNITTGVIKSANYVLNTAGTKIDLLNGSIDSKNFKIDSNGNLTLTGEINATSGSFSGSIYSSSGSIGGFSLSPSSLMGNSGNVYLYKDGRFSFQNDYGWINCGAAGTWIQGNSRTYPCYILDAYSRPSTDDSTSIRLHTIYGKILATSLTDYGANYNYGGTSLSRSDIELSADKGSLRIYSYYNSFIYGDEIAAVEGKAGAILTSRNTINIGMASNTIYPLNYNAQNIYVGGSSTHIYLNGTIHTGSSRGIKRKIKELKAKELEEIYNSYKNQKVYSYNYKKKYDSDYQRRRYGFILDEMENTKIGDMIGIKQSITDKNVKTYNADDLAKANFIMIKILLEKIEKLEKEVKNNGR